MKIDSTIGLPSLNKVVTYLPAGVVAKHEQNMLYNATSTSELRMHICQWGTCLVHSNIMPGLRNLYLLTTGVDLYS